MNPLLRDFYGHQAWADAEHWRAIGAHPPARDDPAIRTRLHHIALVQRAFHWTAGDRNDQFVLTKPEDFPSFDDLVRYGRAYHDEVGEFLAGLPDARLDETVTIPWFKDPPLTLTRTEALTQSAMHSHYHRGQNATRLRELGGEPPLTDLIVWYSKGRPAPDYDVVIG
jgi:uncharacterized damage-inducible protein DinB